MKTLFKKYTVKFIICILTILLLFSLMYLFNKSNPIIFNYVSSYRAANSSVSKSYDFKTLNDKKGDIKIRTSNIRKYYISSDGNDNNDGSINSPWATLSKISSLLPNDHVYLRCGDAFYGEIIPPTSVPISSQVTISSYGLGKKPVVSLYKVLNVSASWIQDSANVWKIDISDVTKFTGNITSINANIGFIKVDNVIKPFKKWSKSELVTQWDFYSDNSQYLYVYSIQNPLTLANDIKAAPNGNLVKLKDSIKIINLELCGSGGHGVDGTSDNGYVGNCDIHEIGGSMLKATTRYGNGIQLWRSSKDTLIEHNNIFDCYDVAFTMQGELVGSGFVNIEYRNNIDWNNTQSFEVWSKGSVANTGFFNCTYKNNISINAGYGWSYSSRPDKNSASSLYLQMMEAPSNDITVTNNIFYNPRQGVICSNAISNGEVPNGYKEYDNYVFLKRGNPIKNWKLYIYFILFLAFVGCLVHNKKRKSDR